MVRRVLFLVLVMSVVLPGVTQVEWDARLNKEVSLMVEVGSIMDCLKGFIGAIFTGYIKR
ncbi:MAG: hypothetical protein K6T17_06210 [Fimbriimonadales bacterium]|nr:hypothetical protein [Fimbriimonadales bacterium]